MSAGAGGTVGAAGAAGAAGAYRIDVLSVFPAMVDAFCAESLLGRARRDGLVDLRCHDLRDWGDATRRVDDAIFGGGPGMLLRAEPVFAAVEAVGAQRPLFVLSPGGARFDQAMARRLAAGPGFSLVCGRYEGVDHRVVEYLADGEISVGDLVLAGGEVAACLVIEAATRLLAGVVGNEASPEDESFAEGLLEAPQYTRPAVWRGWEVPEVLRGGDHARIARWRRAQALHRTIARRPDLVDARGGLDERDRRLLEEFPAVPYPEGSP